jgi:D-sedoheptulose 7-phosphate isomerase
MKARVESILLDLVERLPALGECLPGVRAVYDLLEACFASGGKLLVCGNGGSASDAEHIVGELLKGFRLRRELGADSLACLRRAIPDGWEPFAEALQGALPAISLVGQGAFSTAFSNDVAPDMAFAQQVFAYGRPGDLLLALSTSGESKNLVNAALAAKAFGLGVAVLAGRGGGALGRLADACVMAPADETYRVQELHLPIYHALCAMLEEEFFGVVY